MRQCGLKFGTCSGQIPGPAAGIVACFDSPSTLGCVYKHPESDLSKMLGLLKKAGSNARSWRVNEAVAKDGSVVKFEGFVLVHGAEEDGPYTEYLFDLAGNIVQGGATSYYSRGTETLEKA